MCRERGWGRGVAPFPCRETVRVGHIGQLWDTCDPEVKTLTCAEQHTGKLRSLFLLPDFLTTGPSNQQAAAIKECALTNSKYPLNN